MDTFKQRKTSQRCIILTHASVSSQIQSQICHKSILQVISHQIKDKLHNHHGLIGLLRLGLVLKEVLVFLDIQTYLESKHKNLASNSK